MYRDTLCPPHLKEKKTRAPHPSCLFFTCEHTAPIHHPPILQVATNTFSVTAPEQWQTAKTRAPRREEERRKVQRNGDSCLKPQQPLLCSALLTIPPSTLLPPGPSVFHTSSVLLSPSDIGSCSEVLTNAQCEATDHFSPPSFQDIFQLNAQWFI